ncbi:acrylyl-CoA reductase (NADPH) [Curtobacterium sp. PhB172]|uniref:acrylyl-CoA reductase family protein n=1 Tax=unclassified Curtobacterium TaxID=257496 RepID=UPI000F4733B7|nr:MULTISPECIES: acryloyl-CoA reductase [unclassified Curtobacterium]ROQ16668.1 acrylyl-CoA reductase (NADPH) [Curtobacterium sp. PhB171]ROQ25256.1 acrylyl-CoA reductase (NADPH) [Curtobacterium sp. PhB170]ROS36707.1 acrylyl-CoA reductase (NADPH) [Curtobacterium sp. PhB131]ROS68558.1 acrylyl-CoA reductase (NADPH) [Curtobacterium sp. PhB172]ROS71384.1 acrylyl-CoA reductase (NADPH) [Curtobacterium sp. PhB141]
MTRAVVVSSSAPPTVADVDLPDPTEGEALVDVTYSSVNYKDGLALARNPGVARVDPLVPGIDVVGTVSALGPGVHDVAIGDRIVLNGAGLGETRHGGWAQHAVVPSGSLVVLPAAIEDSFAAAIGTAGFTAMLSVLALERFVEPGAGRVLVTGASGGVGTVAIALLDARGYEVTASTGRSTNEASLRRLGATEVVDRGALSEPGKPMQRAAWAGAVDSVGGATLANVLAGTRWGGAVTACGLAQDSALPTTVLPFILRAVSLLGINSVDAPSELRHRAWERLATDLDPALLAGVTRTVTPEQAIEIGVEVVAGRVHGRTVVDVRG